MAEVVDLQLARMDNSPWGFRLQGGTDFGTPLIIQRVNAKSPSEGSGLLPGDVILKVNGVIVDNLKHKQVQDKIIQSGNRFQLTVSRGGVLSQTLTRPSKQLTTPSTPRPNPEGREWNNTLEADRAGAADNAEEFTKHFMAQLRGDEPPVLGKPQNLGPDFIYTSDQIGHKNFEEPQGNNRIGGRPQQPHMPQQSYLPQQPQQVINNQPTPTPMKKVASMMNNKQYNSPHHLYSDDNLGEVLTQQAEVLANGVKGVEIKDDNSIPFGSLGRKPGNNLNSATLRMVQELDSKGPEPEPGRDVEPHCTPAHYKGLTNRNIQSASFLMLQKALEEEEDLSVNPIGGGKVQAPRVQSDRTGTASPRTCPSPGGSLNRRGSSGFGRNVSTPTHFSQSASRPESTDVIDYSSNKQKKVGNSFQWPPSNTGSPVPPAYMNPGGSRTQSPAPRRFESPVRTESPAHAAAANGNASRTSTPSGVARPQNGNQAGAQQPHNSGIQHAATQQNQQMNEQSKLSAKEEWSKILDAHPLVNAGNAADFTKNLIELNFGGQQPQPHQQQQMMSSTVTTNSNSFSQSMFSNQKPQPVPAMNQPTTPRNQPMAPLNHPINKPSAPINPPTAPMNQPASTVPGSGQNLVAPKRGKGILTQQRPGLRQPMCGACDGQIRGPFITALGKTWCPSHFLCNMESCRKSLQETGFVEEQGMLYCEDCYAKYLAPDCDKCRTKIVGNCLKAMGKKFHPECFNCAYCGKLFSNSPFYLEDGLPYCEEDWNDLFTTKCVACSFPIEAGDRWVEAINNNYHSQCFNCTLCRKNLEGESFFVKSGKPFCKGHAKI